MPFGRTTRDADLRHPSVLDFLPMIRRDEGGWSIGEKTLRAPT